MKKIGVFDSGIGGKSVANALEKAFPNDEVVYISDSKNLPYGTKTPEKLKELVNPKMEELSKKGVDVIVIACNTVSTTILGYVRKIVDVPVIGVVPMVREAVKLTKSDVIAVCATPTTLKSERYSLIKNKYAKNIHVVEPDCSRWTKMIEDNKIDRKEISQKISNACEAGADVIVLGCTHYHWIEKLIEEIAKDKAVVIHPEAKLIKKVEKVLARQLTR